MEKVLSNEGVYKASVMRMMEENAAMDPLGPVERCVMELAKEST